MLTDTQPADTPADAATPRKRLSFGFAKRHGALLKALTPDAAQLQCRATIASRSLAELRRYFGVPLQLEVMPPEQFERLLQQSYEGGSGEAFDMMGTMGEEDDLSSIAQELDEPEDLLESEDDAPIIRLLNALLTQAIKEGASDIHLDTFEGRMAVRFRVDGVLREVLEPNRHLAPLLVSRIKVMARLDIAEKRLPQDGRISLRIAGRPVDVRVSTLPVGQGGERVVLRLLDKQAGRLDLEHLGMEQNAMRQLDKLIHRPHGIILVTGPTGSGKTTTLYAGLARLNDNQRNIMTVEDPIEYYIDGISQTAVNTKVKMSFARGLRAILRQDPDVVMVGEIRDLETAEIAVQASLTGHLVLSTLHTNTAVGAMTRLRDMGVEPFLLSSSLIGVLAQRLVRLLCPHCKQAHPASASECESFGWDAANPPTLYRAQGCPECKQVGYIGRTGIYELVIVDEPLQTMIHDGASEQQMERHARQTTAGIRDDGLRRVLAGATSLEEVLRVTKEN
ncbi:type II secretion system protein GspE [Candidatus Tenderia electrophaga]|jgi:general secretion pathway protein E|uniref:Type II secretion system protein E n=1 Tax=Candidatus Tenderia electrophaga TaxID=1748243 RepID=A0A0S2TGU9_9GAMM|nr:type II secretion system protein GspE [Candidatus Tenderia electrophaga]